MKELLMQGLAFLGKHRDVFLVAAECLVIVILSILACNMFQKWKAHKKEQDKPENAIRLYHDFTGDINEVERQNVIREMLAPDGVDPNPNTYMGISDGGREYYVRLVTISKMPKNVRFAETLKPLFQFPNCTSTVFVDPIDSEDISRKIDKQINVLESEQLLNKDNTNRVRKLGNQIAETTRQAMQVERDDKKYFNAGFLFKFVAPTVEELNRITDDFRAVALNKKMDISNCFGEQSEAFLASLPLNREGQKLFGKINSDCIKMFLMDQEALSVILNYTSDHFSHKKGIPLGRNLFDARPFVFDIYDPSHDGFTVVICGKTNSGKSATIKIMIERYVPLGYRFVLIDSQTRKGTNEGEYASVTEINGGTNFKVSSNDENIINVFDVEESIEFVKETATTGYEKRTLDLNGAITDMLYNLRSMMQIGAGDTDVKLDAVMDSDINDILLGIIKSLFEEKGIVHGDADSLYEEGKIVKDGFLQSGLIPKLLPTVCECYKKILLGRKYNRSPEVDNAYRLIVNNLKEYVRELYYTEESCLFFTREEYLNLPNSPHNSKQKVYKHDDGTLEPVIAFFGIRPYFDGQSTIRISRTCPVTNIDISQLPETERKVAREIATRFMNERFIKKNSENADSFDKIVGVVDEAHEEFEYTYGRKTYANIVRTARKRHAGMIFATQTVKEFYRYDETEDIIKQAAVKMIFKQDKGDGPFLMEKLCITESQSNIIVSGLGVVADKNDPNAGRKRKGEMCVIDGEQCLFVKVDMLGRTEALAVETDSTKVMTERRRAG